jgi:hypothetical protein
MKYAEQVCRSWLRLVKQGAQELMAVLYARGDEAAVRRLIAVGADVNVRNEVGERQCILINHRFCLAGHINLYSRNVGYV